MAETVMLIGSVAQPILNKLSFLGGKQISLLWGFAEDLVTLKRRVEVLQALLRDAEKVPLHLETLRVWLKNAKLVADDAQCPIDVIDEYFRRESKKSWRGYITRPINNQRFRLKMAPKVRKMNLLLDKICKEAWDVGLRPAELVNAAAAAAVAVAVAAAAAAAGCDGGGAGGGADGGKKSWRIPTWMRWCISGAVGLLLAGAIVVILVVAL